MKSILILIFCISSIVCRPNMEGEGYYKLDGAGAGAGADADADTATASASGGEENVAVHGSYSYTAPDGKVITVNYVADENGFQPVMNSE